MVREDDSANDSRQISDGLGILAMKSLAVLLAIFDIITHANTPKSQWLVSTYSSEPSSSYSFSSSSSQQCAGQLLSAVQDTGASGCQTTHPAAECFAAMTFHGDVCYVFTYGTDDGVCEGENKRNPFGDGGLIKWIEGRGFGSWEVVCEDSSVVVGEMG